MEKKNCVTVFLQGRCQFQTSELSQLKKGCKRKVAVNCFWKRRMHQGEVTKRNPVFLLPPKCHFSVCFCSKWQSLHAWKYTPQTYTVLTWLTFHPRILFKYKKIDTSVEKAPNGAKLQHIYAWKKLKLYAFCQQSLQRTLVKIRVYFLPNILQIHLRPCSEIHCLHSFFNIKSNPNFLTLWRPKIFIHYNSSLL